MSKDVFKAFVAEKAAEANKEPVNWEHAKDDWLQHLTKLRENVDTWLTPYIQNQSIRLGQETLTLDEENIGSYSAPMTTISIGSERVKLEPIGTLLLGARGRVDMKGPKGIARLVVVPKDSTGPRGRVETIGSGHAPSHPVEQLPVSQWVWKLASSPPKITYTDLTEDAFLDALMGVVNG